MSEKEAKVYLTVLELWSAPASTIGRRSGIKRVTAYAILKDLQMKHIVSSVEKDGVHYFQVISPEKLKQKLIDKVSAFESIMPQLLANMDVYNNKPKIEYFEGISWLKEMYDDLLSSQSEICAFLSFEETPDELHDYLILDFLPRRIEKWIHAKVILPPHDKNQQYIWIDKDSLKESRMIDNTTFDFIWEINLYGPNKVMFASLSWEELSGVIFHSSKMYYSMKHIFDFTWNNLWTDAWK